MPAILIATISDFDVSSSPVGLLRYFEAAKANLFQPELGLES
jgi:hypothetical protein